MSRDNIANDATGHADPNREEADSLRKQHANEETVRRVEAGTKRGAGSEGHAAAFEMWTDDELRKRADELGLDSAGKSREELIAAVEHH